MAVDFLLKRHQKPSSASDHAVLATKKSLTELKLVKVVKVKYYYKICIYIIHKDKYASALHQAKYFIIVIPTRLAGTTSPLSITPEPPITQMISGSLF